MADGKKILEHFSSACNEIHAGIENQRPKGTLYKYMSFQGLENILTKKKLHFTDYRFFNDPTELLFGKNIIKNTLLESEIPNLNKDFTIVLNDIFDNFDNHFQTYVGCFSASIKKLALWRYYACNGTGFAIGFNERFSKISPPAKSNLGKAVVCSVIYGEKNAKHLINKFIDQYIAAFKTAQNDPKLVMDLSILLTSHLIPFLPGFKDESFIDEDEIRMFYTEGEGMIIPDTQKPFYFDDSQREFIQIEKHRYPFVKNFETKKPVLLHDFSAEEISEIWIGPCCEFIEARTAVRKALLENGFDLSKIEIQQAKLPLQYI